MQTRAERGSSYGRSGASVWRKKEDSVNASRGNTPFAQVGNNFSQEPAARLTNLNKTQKYKVPPHTTANSMEEPYGADALQQPYTIKVVVTLPAELRANLRS